jgi:hypothetical protein
MISEEARQRRLTFELHLSYTIQLLVGMIEVGEASLNSMLDEVVERVHREQDHKVKRRHVPVNDIAPPPADEDAIKGIRRTGEFHATIDFGDEQKVVDRVKRRLQDSVTLYDALLAARKGLCAIPLLSNDPDDVARDAVVFEIDKVLESFQ